MSIWRRDKDSDKKAGGALSAQGVREQEDEFEDLAEHTYLRVSRSLSASILFVLPLLLVYEVGVLLVQNDPNAVAVWFKRPVSWLRHHPVQIVGATAMLILNGVFIVAVFAAAVRLWRRDAFHGGTFIGMFLESCAYALLLGPIAALPLTGRLGFSGFAPHVEHFWAKVFISCGAGLYEEFLFRFLLLGAIFLLARELGKLRPVASGLLALVVSAVLFSAAHLLSPGETPNGSAFAFRLGAGIVLGIIFLTRGFGIAAWTHALYDVYILCFAGG